MHRLLVAVFDKETAANVGLQALHQLHGQGDVTLYASGVVARAESLKIQLTQATGDIKARLDERVTRVNGFRRRARCQAVPGLGSGQGSAGGLMKHLCRRGSSWR